MPRSARSFRAAAPVSGCVSRLLTIRSAFIILPIPLTPATITPMQARVLAFVLAGGKGTRLSPLTKERAKPATPFGGRYRIVDFVLSNLVNSGIYSVYVLIQFRSQSLLQHIREGWEAASLLKQHFIIPVPAQMRTVEEEWYRGTADAMYQ